METIQSIQKRCSLKDHLSPKPIEPEKLEAVLNAARLAPSARNMQPWRFVVVQGRAAVEALVDEAFIGTNQIIRQAPVILLACAKPDDDVTADGKPYFLFDLGLAVENLLLAATDLGLVTHLILRFDEAKVKHILGIPEEYRVVISTPLAYPFERSYAEAARDRLAQRTRKELDEVVFFDHWQEKVSS